MSENTHQRPLVSVIVPVYNVAHYLNQCLEALCAQTLHNIEIIVIDDGSTDNSLDIIETFASADERIRVIAKRNEGYGVTINLGIDSARAPYIAIVESDDYPEHSMLKKLYEAAIYHDADVVKCDFYDTFEDHESPRRNLAQLPYGKPFNAKDFPEVFLITPSIWASLYKKKFLDTKDIRLTETPGASFQDTAFCLTVLCEAKNIVALGAPLIHYRRDNMQSSTYSKDKIFTVSDEFRKARERLASNHDLYRAYIPYIRLNEWRTYCWDSQRIDQRFIPSYFVRVRYDFDIAYRGNEINEALFTPRELFNIKRMLKKEKRDFENFNPQAPAPVGESKENIKISIVIPAHNDERFMARTIDSCLAQTHRNIEIICVNDASTDKTKDVLDSYIHRDKRIKVKHLEANVLTHLTRLHGVRMATGDIITFLDADDEIAPEMCERMAAEYVKDPYDILHMATKVVVQNENDKKEALEMQRWCMPPRGTLAGEDILTQAFVNFGYAANLAGKGLRASLVHAAFESLGEIYCDRGEDQMEYFAIACRATKYRTVRLKYYIYHLDDGFSLKNSLTAEEFERPLRGIYAIEGLSEFLDRAGMLPEYADILELHFANQLNFMFDTCNTKVREEDQNQCYARIVQVWNKDNRLSRFLNIEE